MVRDWWNNSLPCTLWFSSINSIIYHFFNKCRKRRKNYVKATLEKRLNCDTSFIISLVVLFSMTSIRLSLYDPWRLTTEDFPSSKCYNLFIQLVLRCIAFLKWRIVEDSVSNLQWSLIILICDHQYLKEKFTKPSNMRRFLNELLYVTLALC